MAYHDACVRLNVYSPSLSGPSPITTPAMDFGNMLRGPYSRKRVAHTGPEVSNSSFFAASLQLHRPPLDLVNCLMKEIVPSRISFFLRLLEMDLSGDGKLQAKEIFNPRFKEHIESEKQIFLSYISSTSVISALFAFGQFAVILTATTDINLDSHLVDDFFSDAFNKDLLFAYLTLCEMSCLLGVMATLTCVIWCAQCQTQTPISEDAMWFIIDHNAAIPVAMLAFAVVLSVFGIQCYIFITFGYTIGAVTGAVCGSVIGLWCIVHLIDMIHIIRNLKRRAATAVEAYVSAKDGNGPA